MNKILAVCFLICIIGMTTSCSDESEHDIVGVWLLTTRTVDIPFDVNQDGESNTNLTKEIDCNKEETLTFKNNGSVFSGNEFSNPLQYYKEDTTNVYRINSDCNTEGIISFASEYNITDEDTIKISDRVYVLQQNTLTTVYKNAVDIYNEDFTEVLETKDLTLVYTKQ
ncbi:hypothetical protein ITJ86_05460 [Winogradskyella sp. F6397]|uniref:Lipocalin-like domain-containing protein n=1 Tax=Winogradskyella marina TaxID=2785530 RepID=A0ABS0EFV4_9FLAO|nr:hypothetical protein [Winogradskyella marina]MBF8149333.1 hypothetical protein [Winogradskyella marina]